MKRPAPSEFEGDITAGFTKRRRMHHHRLQHKQQWEVDPRLAPQNEAFFRSQLLRSITLALAAAGFDSARPSALEELLALTENYMSRFLLHVKTQMEDARRSTPTPQDFTHALAATAAPSSSLRDHLDLTIPPHITQPTLLALPPDEPPVPDLDPILGPDLSGAAEARRRPYIPPHLPSLPSRHAWQSTPVFTTRETDPLKMRERATQEGILAEKALRRLARAAKAGRAGARRGAAAKKEDMLFERAMQAAREEDEAARRRDDADTDFGIGAAGEEARGKGPAGLQAELDEDDGVRVNWEAKYWRRSAASAAALG